MHKEMTNFINSHGIFFKKKARYILQRISQVQVLGEEHPVEFMDGGQIDLLIKFAGKKFKYFIPVECKRVERNKWIFFKDEDTNLSTGYYFSEDAKKGLTFFERDISLCVEGIEGKEKTNSEESLYKIGMQVSKNYLGFVSQEFEQRNKQLGNKYKRENFFSFPLIITSAELFICDSDVSKIDLNGKLEVANFEKTGCVILRFPFVPREFSTSKLPNISVSPPIYIDPKTRNSVYKTDIAVVNINNLKDFFDLIDKSDIESVKKYPEATASNIEHYS